MRPIKVITVSISLIVLFTRVHAINAGERADLNREAVAALNHLYSISGVARRLGESAKAVLVFPSITRPESNTGSQRFYGVLLVDRRVVGYYKLVGSYRLAGGVQRFRYAIFFMSDEDLVQLRKTGRSESDTGPGVVVQENQTPQQQSTSPSSINAMGASITHSGATNDQQEAAPRPDDAIVDPTYGGFIPVPNMGVPRAPSSAIPRKGVYAFSFADGGLIPGLSLAGTKIMPMKTTEN